MRHTQDLSALLIQGSHRVSVINSSGYIEESEEQELGFSTSIARRNHTIEMNVLLRHSLMYKVKVLNFSYYFFLLLSLQVQFFGLK